MKCMRFIRVNAEQISAKTSTLMRLHVWDVKRVMFSLEIDFVHPEDANRLMELSAKNVKQDLKQKMVFARPKTARKQTRNI